MFSYPTLLAFALLLFSATLLWLFNRESRTILLDAPLSSLRKLAGNPCENWQNWRERYKSCLIKNVESAPAEHRHEGFRLLREMCWPVLGIEDEADLRRRFRIHVHINLGGEAKLAIREPEGSRYFDASCTLVTLGVGGDIEAERKLRDERPKCEFFGADPILEPGRAYEKIGKYFQVAVSAESSEHHRASVLQSGECFL